MKMADFCTGIQHIGIPTGALKTSEAFYTGLGFRVVNKEFVKEQNQNVLFLQMKNLMLEIYEEEPVKKAGAINHFALDCTDIEQAYATACEKGYSILSDGICALDFWERGIRYFIIQGPDKERIEFCQRL